MARRADAFGDCLVERRRHRRIDRSDGDALHALGDHGLDERDLSFDISGRRALAVDDFHTGMRRRISLGGVLHGREERYRELRDEAEFDRLVRGGGPGDRADQVYDSIERTCGLLNDHPRLGRARPEIQPEARSIVIERWLALYRITEDGAPVVRIIDGARDLSAIEWTPE